MVGAPVPRSDNLRAVLSLLLIALLLWPALGVSQDEPAAEKPDTSNNSKVIVKGLSGDQLKNALRAIELRALRTDSSRTPAQVERLYKRAPEQIRRSLEPFGYYHAEVVSTLRENSERRFYARFEINLGKPVRVREMSITIDGAARFDKPVMKAVQRLPYSEGDVLLHSTYESYKGTVLGVLAERGYLDATLVENRINVSLEKKSADIRLAWESGGRYRISEVRFTGSELSADVLQSFVPFRENAMYLQSRLLELQNRLTDSGYFASVEVFPMVDEAKEGIVPIEVTLSPAKRTAYTAGLSFGTDSGAGIRGAMERRWVNDRGHKFKAETTLGQRLSGAGVAYEIPLPGPDRRSVGLLANWRDETTDTTESTLSSLSAYLQRNWNEWVVRGSVNFLSGDFVVAQTQGTSTLFYPELSVYRRDADDYSYPRSGYAVGATVRAASKLLGADTSVYSVQANATLIRSFAEDWRVIGRAQVGILQTDDFSKLPPSLRFFAGGDRSIRGYDYQALGPRNAQGLVIGGEALAVLSAEVERTITGPYGLAAFVDVGNAFDRDEQEVAVGAGLGLRWRSPIGLVRIDVARGFSDPKGFRLHLAIGSEL